MGPRRPPARYSGPSRPREVSLRQPSTTPRAGRCPVQHAPPLQVGTMVTNRRSPRSWSPTGHRLPTRPAAWWAPPPPHSRHAQRHISSRPAIRPHQGTAPRALRFVRPPKISTHLSLLTKRRGGRRKPRAGEAREGSRGPEEQRPVEVARAGAVRGERSASPRPGSLARWELGFGSADGGP